MNYRHHFHAGNFADVMKHVLLVALIRALQKKEKGFLYLDTHAGRGSYDLTLAATGDSLARTPEWPEGVGRVLGRLDLPPAVVDYCDLVRSFDQREGNLGDSLRFYPGSPAIAAALARPQDRLALIEKHPAECEALRSGLGWKAGLTVRGMDGYEAVRALLPPPERRGLILLDPPFESQAEFAQLAQALGDGLQRFPTGTFAVWYPLTERARVDQFFGALRDLSPPPTLAAELTIAGQGSALKLKGCGLIVINPPWQFDAEIRASLTWLAGVTAQEPGASARIDWLVPER